MYKTEGYQAEIGPVTVPAQASPNTSKVSTLEAQYARTKDPAERARLRAMIQKEQQYATEMAAVKTPMQQAAQQYWSPIFTNEQERLRREMMATALRQKYGIIDGAAGPGILG